MTKRVAAHPGELLQCSCLPGVVESQHQDAELFAADVEAKTRAIEYACAATEYWDPTSKCQNLAVD